MPPVSFGKWKVWQTLSSSYVHPSEVMLQQTVTQLQFPWFPFRGKRCSKLTSERCFFAALWSARGRVKVKQCSQDGVNSTRQQSPHTKLTHQHEKVSEMKSTRSGERWDDWWAHCGTWMYQGAAYCSQLRRLFRKIEHIQVDIMEHGGCVCVFLVNKHHFWVRFP